MSRAELVEPAQQPLGSGGAPPHAVTLDSLQVAALTAPRPAGGAAWRYILSGGAPPPPPPPGARHPSALLLTGHRDGRARVWDATCEVRAPKVPLAVEVSTQIVIMQLFTICYLLSQGETFYLADFADPIIPLLFVNFLGQEPNLTLQQGASDAAQPASS